MTHELLALGLLAGLALAWRAWRRPRRPELGSISEAHRAQLAGTDPPDVWPLK